MSHIVFPTNYVFILLFSSESKSWNYLFYRGVATINAAQKEIRKCYGNVEMVLLNPFPENIGSGIFQWNVDMFYAVIYDYNESLTRAIIIAHPDDLVNRMCAKNALPELDENNGSLHLIMREYSLLKSNLEKVMDTINEFINNTNAECAILFYEELKTTLERVKILI
ncbi:hypothetical protein COEREDRAFT_87703 [Coemansia reversa NRRL 1564]|uniref:Uncharacterized protein n=1 Tax=Coemansia reversa (strain ATCC 12441 / NRRL 1564) TaxID=763665 RepID=A0A2G5B929_COERN|nr:hypothetical protein COEREDRAFT_87703 [Coemansia reversa NRRL 1564]|eukprot:PIA15511.1 hypothetical protein COEREDRAFT_87703 [Coemansia reversa NRRL 1564]